MTFCSAGNLSFIVKVMEMKGIYDIEGDRISGQIGSLVDITLPRGKRDCKMIETYEFGKEFENKSFDGGLGQLERKEGDIFFFTSTQYLKKDFFEHSDPVMVQKYTVSHPVTKGKKATEIDILFLAKEFEFNIKISFILASLCFLVILFSLSYSLAKKKIVRKMVHKILANILINFFRFRNDYKHPYSIIGLALIFYYIFFFFFKLICCNQITTLRVVVDTKYIIDSMDKLLNSKLVICWMKHDAEMSMAEASPPGSKMWRLLHEKKYSIPQKDMEDEISEYCQLSIKRIGQQIDFGNRVIFMNEGALYGFISSFIAPKRDVSYWISENPMLETIGVYYYRKELTAFQEKIIQNNNQWKMQSGISQYSFNKILQSSQKMIRSTTSYYSNLNSFILDYTFFNNLELSFMRRTLFCLILVYGLILFAFLIEIYFHERRRMRLRQCIKLYYRLFVKNVKKLKNIR